MNFKNVNFMSFYIRKSLNFMTSLILKISILYHKKLQFWKTCHKFHKIIYNS